MRRCPHAQTIEAMSYEKGLPSIGRPERAVPAPLIRVKKSRGRKKWRSLGDSNPCFRRERATSWAARRREPEPHEIALIHVRCKHH